MRLSGEVQDRPGHLGVREVRRLETRARLFDAALAEIGRSGLAGADVTAIAAAAGVVRGTFYFHFPTKEHVLVELIRNEEDKIVAELDDGLADAGNLVSIFTSLVGHVVAAERRLGPVVFRDMLGLYFSSARPAGDEAQSHPLLEFVVGAITVARSAGRVPSEAVPGELGVFFMTGLYALLATGLQRAADSGDTLRRYVTTIVNGMETR